MNEDALPHENLPLSASSISFPPILYWSLLQDSDFAHQLWSRRRTSYTLERTRKIFHEAAGKSSLSPQQTDRPLHVSRGGERGCVKDRCCACQRATMLAHWPAVLPGERPLPGSHWRAQPNARPEGFPADYPLAVPWGCVPTCLHRSHADYHLETRTAIPYATSSSSCETR